MLMQVSSLRGLGNVASLSRGLLGRGLGRLGAAGDCTPTNCPDGPYSNAENNYAYWLNQTTNPNQEQPGSQTQPITVAQMTASDPNQPALMSYYDLLQQAMLKSCDPRDATCISQNESDQAAVEDYWVSHNMRVPVGTKLSFGKVTPAQVKQFYDAANPFSGGNVVDTTGILTAVIQKGVDAVTGGASPSTQQQQYPAVTRDGGKTYTAQNNPQINPGSVTIANTTRPGAQSFRVGDGFSIQISGATPGQTVSADSRQNGNALGSKTFGTTDSSGSYAVSGVMGVGNIGQWVETWYVGGVMSGSASFTVSQSPGPSQSQSTTPPDVTQGANTIVKALPSNPATGTPVIQPAASPLDAVTNFLTGSFNIGQFEIPVWALGVGAGVAVMALSGGKGHR